ncbi:unnamed protein product [Rotaria sp. Silwood2]|nr:unnamed protein product [Rotaria sp. Silwood2]CAF4138688.1 unnamed protein product [Rotaria sp. Silwood2]CAF4355528.1 unnamed protein product [Rotaria sp. Silwood2]
MQVVPIFGQSVVLLGLVSSFFKSFSEARGAAGPVLGLINEGDDPSINEKDVWNEDTEVIYNINGDIEFENVSFIYPSRKDTSVLQNLSLIARAGQTTALIGPSGCDATQAEIEQAAREANAHDFIMQLPNKYETLVGERGIQLSGGEKQRIALARALVKQPTFLLLDELTSALDNVSEKIVQGAIDRACKGCTTIIIAHRLTTIQNADQIYILDNGNVIERGTHEILMAKEGGKYQAMIKRQQIERIDYDKDDLMSMQTYTAFATSGSALTQRIRSKAFACLLRQEVAYFDRPENSSGAICNRLSSDASAIQEMTGTRLGVIFEAIALTLVGVVIDFRGDIKFDQVKFIYPSRPTSVILKRFELNIKPRQRVALVGASGCGKSTIIQLLERFYDVTSDQLLLDGTDIRQLNLHWVRSTFGLVSQEPILFDLTIAENIAYGLENVSMEDIMNAANRANIHEFIDQLPQGYETRVGWKGSFLSGGEKQRIAIARVLLRRPKVLLLDEATSAMDSFNEKIVQEALEQVQTENFNTTSLIVAHRLSTIRSCDLICVLDQGHIVESGTHAELMQRRGAYYGMLIESNLQ